MNRFEYTEPALSPNEYFLVKENNAKLYDGDQKTNFEGGMVHITTHRIFWGKPGHFANGQICLALPIQLIIRLDEEVPGTFSFSKSKKIVLYLKEPSPDRNEGPQLNSIYNFVKISFRDGYSQQISIALIESINKRRWEMIETPTTSAIEEKPMPNIKLRTGIIGIERSLIEKQKAADESINVAFQDLSKLMTMAKDMVRLSQNISTKIREKQGDITEDETVRFKSYLMSLGIDDPVTRDAFKSDNQYYRSLAKQICDIMVDPIEEIGGMMVLTDIYCRVNRARGLELLSPEDVLNACNLMQNMDLPLKLHVFDSGVKVLQLACLDSEIVAEGTAELLTERGSLNAEELAQFLGISVILAKERLLSSERCGKSCRDDSIEGLRFYPNLFLLRD
ncbi:PREDICTED: vacuolar protein-sorting-associated protein 36 [Nicrophorus vespilloides]|uniref:Vacuolar protein-sorting-associated protein 36 n=1 Tax=Nicrophorus vespilloides TaxID=110193 RepID=A0ABM1NA79_NICVS|nr:PREDICTED: vacuolar protein-sorting-associated protein 36 [Nicrophorus vespilloides]